MKINDLKEQLSADKIKNLLANKGVSPTLINKGVSWSANFQKGLQDIKSVLEDGKFALFAKQLVVLLVVFLLVRYGYTNMDAKKAKIKDDMAALQIQQINKSDYEENKQHLLRLEPLFPDIGKKQEWMLVRLSDIFEKRKIQANIDGNPEEHPQASYLVSSQLVTFMEDFQRIGELLSDIENGEDFFRISSIVITKQTDKEHLGTNAVAIQFNTAFPNHKYAATLFKDYNQQMERIKLEQAADKDKSEKTQPAGGETK